MPCQYFRSTDNPTAAQITAIDNGGMYILRVTPSEGQPFNQRFVFHKDDPALADRPADWRSKHGVWDYIPGYPRYEDKAMPTDPSGVIVEEKPLLAPQSVPAQPQRPQSTGPLQRSGSK